ncbi:MAG TPA: AMIN domain-containing protein, partial [Chromatiaceae bacterium]|nr:AMIN domain-containing protein [Chromatiaceae bacterium]
MVGGKMGLNKKMLLGLLLLLAQASVAVANTLEEISYSTLSGGRIQIVLKTSEPVTEVSSFATDNPARIAIDLPGTRSALASKTKTISSGIARSVTAIEAGDKTRVVVNLLNKALYEVRTEGNRTLVVINAESGSEPGKTVVTAAGQSSASGGGRPEITKIDFRRGGKGVARVEVHLSDPGVSVDMRQEGTSVV